jgi:ribose/xylose/arabinose/galactoside ABC-type transport system permease subunit
MTETTVSPADESATPTAPTAPSAVEGQDERLAYRGLFQRMFIRPEIGALIGVVGIWVFFWAVTVPFGTANGASNLIDYASSPLGIMAVAVSMLMIGGEFDLSAGAMTGAMGILVIMLSKEAGEFGGAGLTLWVAIPLSLAVALSIGYMNGWLVEKTRLPSFTITLATYYVLIGAKLGFSKLIVDQVQVGDISDANGYGFWNRIFASQWNRTTHVFENRDKVYTVCLLLAIALVVVAVVEMQFSRKREAYKSAGLIQFVVGAGVTVAGIVTLHQTDGLSGNWLGSAIIAVGTIVGLHGYATWRLEPAHERGSFRMTPDMLKWLLLGVASVAAAIIVAWVMDAYEDTNFFFPFTYQGFRATLFMLLSAVGFTAILIAVSKARRVSRMTHFGITLIGCASVVVMAFFIRWESQGDPDIADSVGSVKFRAEAFSCLLGLGLFVLAWAILNLLFEERTAVHPGADRIGRRLIVAGGVLATIGMVTKLLYVTQEELDAGAAPALFSVRTIWAVVFTIVMVWVLGSARFGSWTFAVGGNKEASRQVGVPAARTKTQLFMLVSGAAWLVGMLLAFRLHTIQANTGNGEEFDYIIAAVVGGTLLTGGYGTALGGMLGACIVAMATLGITFARWNSDWRFLFLGVTLLLAMLANRWIRTRAEGMRR